MFAQPSQFHTRAIVTTLCAAALAVIGLAACSSNRDKTTTLGVSMHEYAIDLSTARVPAGKVLVRVANEGKIAHELVAFRTDLGDAALPLISDGTRINEDGAGITHLDPEAEDVGPSANKSITLRLTRGRYVLVCNLATHYTSGMHAALTVT